MLFTKDKCLEDLGTVKVKFFGKMAPFIQDSGNIAMLLVKANSVLIMERYTKVNGKMVDQMDKEAIKTQKMQFSKVSIRITCSLGLALRRGPMAPSMMETTKTARSMAMECTLGMMDPILKEIGSMVL